VQAAVARVRAGDCPAFVEAVTYRYKGHYGGDPEHTYRTREEVETWRQRDPLLKLKAQLLEAGVPEARLAQMKDTVLKELQADQAWALDQPFLSVAEATDHVLIPLEQQAPQEQTR
jgi:TPP-dependent pyruvate/acetoin dehydrogenase alpha subunit